jgi:protoheme IX farnesyltransferase
MLLTYLSLAKPKILILVAITALASAIVANQGDILFSMGVLLVLAVVLASAGAALLNNYLDKDIDIIMERTRNRPLPNGKVSPTKVFLAGVTLIVLSVPLALWLNYLVALSVVAGALIYVLIYTLWLKRRTSLNIVIGGLAGSCAILAGWFAITTKLSLVPILMASLVFLWTPSHFWSLALAHQESYRKAKIPMLPVTAGVKKASDYILLSSGVLLLVSFLIYFLSSFGEVYLLGSLILGGLFLISNIRLWRRPNRERAWTNFKFSGAYLLGLFLIMVVDVLVY